MYWIIILLLCEFKYFDAYYVLWQIIGFPHLNIKLFWVLFGAGKLNYASFQKQIWFVYADQHLKMNVLFVWILESFLWKLIVAICTVVSMRLIFKLIFLHSLLSWPRQWFQFHIHLMFEKFVGPHKTCFVLLNIPYMWKAFHQKYNWFFLISCQNFWFFV